MLEVQVPDVVHREAVVGDPCDRSSFHNGEAMTHEYHRHGDHDGQRAMEFALEQIRLVQMATPSAKGTFETPESPQGEEAQVAGQATNGASGDNPGRCGSVRTLADSKGSTCRQSESAAPDESNRHCQYAQDVGMPEYRCAVECQYMQSATGAITPSPETLWMVYYEDRDVPPELFFGPGAEEGARRRYKDALNNWSCHLLVRVPTDSHNPKEPK